MKNIITAFIVALVLPSCMPAVAVDPTQTSILIAGNFSLVFKDYSCGTVPFNVLDTKHGTLTQTPLEETTSTTIELRLSDSELNDIYEKIRAIDFFSYPAEFVIPEGYVTITEVPLATYELSITNGENTNTVRWATGGLAQSEYEKANQLWELLRLINSMIYNHPEYKKLPEPQVGCA
jgi:hypothetical protein